MTTNFLTGFSGLNVMAFLARNRKPLRTSCCYYYYHYYLSSSAGKVIADKVPSPYVHEKSNMLDNKTDDSIFSNKIPAARLVSVNLKDDSVLSTGQNVNCDINFENYSEAFAGKSTWEIARALCVLKMCSVNVFVDNSLSIMKWTKRCLGTRGLRILFKPMFYKQFVGGETQKEIQECIRRLAESGIRPMLAATMEEDVGEKEKGDEKVYDANCKRILECMELSTAETTTAPMMQLKMTGLLPPDLLVIIGEVYKKSEDKIPLIKAIAKGLTENSFDIAPLQTVLDEQNTKLLRNALSRLKQIGEEAVSRSMRVLVDAEYTYLNQGLNLFTMAMAATYNRSSPIIWNTYQCYLKDAYNKLQEELSIANKLDLYFGAKVVRGAYVVQERARAQKLGIPDRVCDNYHATNDSYNRISTFLLDYTKKAWPKCSFMLATHNEESIRLAVQKLTELGIDKQKGNVSFGQLYGMSDEITYPLAVAGFPVYKSIPYGTVDEVLPYLARRAIENKSVMEGTRKERSTLWKEMKIRLHIKRQHHHIK